MKEENQNPISDSIFPWQGIVLHANKLEGIRFVLRCEAEKKLWIEAKSLKI